MMSLERLYGVKAQERIRAVHPLIIGIGGVGSWIAEALARSGITQLTLMDLDDICVSNINRQIHALHSTIGQLKVDVLKGRLLDINPELKVHTIPSFFSEKNALEIVPGAFSTVIDACDDFSAKLLLCRLSRQHSFHLLTIGAAGGKRHPSMIRVADMTEAQNDKMLARLRKKLRQEYGFSRHGAFGIDCVYSMERAVYPTADGCIGYEPTQNLKKLDCELGFGSASFVTGSFAFFATAYLIDHWTKE